MIEPPEVFVFGPYIRNSDGKPGHGDAEVRVRAARAHASRSDRPPAPDDLHREHEVGRAEAGAVDDAVDRVQRAVGGDDARRAPARAIGSVTSSTFGRCSAGRKCELNSTRLQPNV